jgi:hypothetical protein
MELSEGKRKKLEYPRGVKVVFPTVATVRSTGGYVSTDRAAIWSPVLMASVIGLDLAVLYTQEVGGEKLSARSLPRLEE